MLPDVGILYINENIPCNAMPSWSPAIAVTLNLMSRVGNLGNQVVRGSGNV